MHTYAAAGVYTATVTASNSVSDATATTQVAVYVPVAGLTAITSSPTEIGSATHFTATVSMAAV
jgi:hypothetical protein